MLAQKRSDITYRAFRLAHDLPHWYEDHEVRQGEGVVSSWVRKGDGYWSVMTLEGIERASDNDWCVEGVSGEYYPMSDESFRKRYEPAADGRWKRIADPLECWLFDTSDPTLMPAWVQRAIEDGLIDADGSRLTVHASWGDQLATLGNDVLINAGERDVYPCKLDVFEATYDVVEKA